MLKLGTILISALSYDTVIHNLERIKSNLESFVRPIYSDVRV